MGLLDGIIGGMAGGGRQQRPGGIGSTVAAGVILALLVKGIRSYENAHPAQVPGGAPGPTPAAQGSGGLGDILGGILGGGRGASGGGSGGGLGGLLGGLGGAGALGALITQLQQRGAGSHVNSWVGTGENQPIAPQEIAHALGEENIADLQQQTGMPREALLSELAQELPEAINQVTPQGQLPDDSQLHALAGAKAS